MGRGLFLDFARNESWQLIGGTVDLYHLAQAAELSGPPLPGNRSQRLAAAAIMQSVVALEATVNAIEHDREDSVNWSARFPHLKFSSLDAISPKDAEAALRVMLEVLAAMAQTCGRSFEIVYFAGNKARSYRERGQATFEEVINGTSAE